MELRQGLPLWTFSYRLYLAPMWIKSPEGVLACLIAGRLLPGFLRFHHTLPIVLDGLAYNLFVRTVHNWLVPATRACLQTLEAFGLETLHPQID